MHDQKKKEKAVLSPEEQAAAAAEHERVGVLYKAVLHTAKVHDYSSQTLEDTEKLLLAVPEAYTAYNCRRRALEVIWQAADGTTGQVKPQASESSSAEAAAVPALTRQEWLCKELKLNSTVLLMNYKNYNAFVHRHWVFDQIEALAKAELVQLSQEQESAKPGSSSPASGSVTNAGDTAPTATTPEAVPSASETQSAAAPTFVLLQQLLQKERAKCEQLLQMDERNFHAWNYRRWVLAQEYRARALVQAYHFSGGGDVLSGESASRSSNSTNDTGLTDSTNFFSADEASELLYTTQKIKSNFSNYSAWHQRSLALKSAAARWQAQLKSTAALESDKDNIAAAATAARAAAHAALLRQLREDVGFLEQAIYCDPNDQSAWFYAPFVLQLLRHPAQTAPELAAARELTDVFVNAVIDLIAEVDRAGSEEECYMPYYFLLDQFINLCPVSGAAAAAAQDSSAALQRYTDAVCQKVPTLTAALGSAGKTAHSRQQSCFRFLHKRLCRADGLRRGLYDDMLAKVLRETA